jgi:hypothetical protein
MIQSFDETECMKIGCDQGHHNYLLHTGRMQGNATKTIPGNGTSYSTVSLNETNRVQRIDFYAQGEGPVNTLSLFCNDRKPATLRSLGLVDNSTDEVFNFDGGVSPVLHQFDRCTEINGILEKKAEDMWNDWKEKTRTLYGMEKVVSTTSSGGCPEQKVFKSADRNEMTSEGLYYPPPIPPSNIPENGIKIGIEPSYGSHNCHNSAIISFAYGYQLPQIIHFVTTLTNTGYTGDLVLGLNSNLTADTRAFFAEYTHDMKSEESVNIVVYELSLSSCKYQKCQVDNLFKDAMTKDWIEDGRPLRQIAMLRFEYQWAFTTLYLPTSKILFTDVRDVYFQKNPMEVEAASTLNSTSIVVFEEASTIGASLANSNWIRNEYGDETHASIKSKMVICSGTTFGGQPAMEVYARAMVYEFDRTKCKKCKKFNDQGFHNYLVHMDRLKGANDGAISAVFVHKQGEGGIVNTIGLVAKRGSGLLREQGLVHNETNQILENDRETISAVVHMADRDPEMKDLINSKIEEELLHWNTTKAILPT